MKLNPTIIIDTREQQPYEFKGLITERATLKTGDYSVKGHENTFAIERKSLNDWVHSITQDRDRFEREIKRAKESLMFFAIIIESDMRKVWKEKLFSKVSKASIVNTAILWQMRYNIPIIWGSNRTQSAYIIKTMCDNIDKYGF